MRGEYDANRLHVGTLMWYRNAAGHSPLCNFAPRWLRRIVSGWPTIRALECIRKADSPGTLSHLAANELVLTLHWGISPKTPPEQRYLMHISTRN